MATYCVVASNKVEAADPVSAGKEFVRGLAGKEVLVTVLVDGQAVSLSRHDCLQPAKVADVQACCVESLSYAPAGGDHRNYHQVELSQGNVLLTIDGRPVALVGEFNDDPIGDDDREVYIALNTKVTGGLTDQLEFKPLPQQFVVHIPS